MTEETLTLGKSELRKDAWDKVTGAAQYVADIPLTDLCHAVIVRSPLHYGRILGINKSAAQNIPGVLRVLAAEDIPGNKIFGPLLQDQPSLAIDIVRHLGEPVAIVIADNLETARMASELVKVEYEPLEPVFDPGQSLKPGGPRLHPEGNLAAQFDIQDGDIEAGFAEADVVLENTFSVPRISPAYMEPENSLARWNEDGLITVWVSSQHPFTDQVFIADALDLPVEKVQVKSAVIGGAFGGKEDSSLAILAALSAWAVRGAVRIVNTRNESFLAHPKRHPALIKMKLGAKRDGTLVALRAMSHMDTGAYASYGPAVGIIFTETLAGSYRIPNVHFETFVAYTNSPLSGAMRGFGSPQSHFALESMLDMLAAELDMHPLALRRKNMLRPGDKMFTGVVVNDTANSLPICLDQAEAIIKRFSQIEPAPGKTVGVGMALAAQSMGLGAKVPDDSTHRLEWSPDGDVYVHLGSPDMGQGLAMAAEQVTAEALGLPYEVVKTIPLDTLTSPNGNVTCASRMTYMVGNALIDAADRLIQQLLDEAARMMNFPREQLSYQVGRVVCPDGQKVDAAEIASRVADDGRTLQCESTFSFPYPEETTPQHLPIGMPHVIFCFGAQIVRVEVDPEIGNVDVTHLVAIHDVGRVISKPAVEGQIEGAVATGLGYALYEEMPLKEHQQWVDSFTEYLIPTTKDVPLNYEIIILEVPEASGPYGAKGIGEIPLVPTAPAVANAVYDAVGVRVKSLPLTPEKLIKI
ncbi:MAG: xanthine dehydrogenase family protein molybdopterin-binding subunit [Anaerolineales bacterium]|nr:xanthine dehydrogenase family protein molybdopterin-binding subunit [Anaerolineales bacterium]